MTQPAGIDPQLDPNANYQTIIDYYLAQWGLSDLSSVVAQLGKTGAGADQINLALQQTTEWKTRFAGNTARAAAGLGVLDPASYIALEGQYRQVLSQLPAGLASQANITDLIGKDVSASELSDRVALANQAWVLAPQGARDAWTQYGFGGAAGAVASILDVSTAEPLLQQQATAAGIGGAALDQGLQLTSQGTALQAAQRGVTIQQAQQAYSQIAQRVNTDQTIANRFAGAASPAGFGQSQEEQATLLGNAKAQKQQNLLYSEEQAQFGGHGGADNTGASNNPGNNF